MNNEANFHELISVINSLPPFIKQPTFKTATKDRSFTDVTNLTQHSDNNSESDKCLMSNNNHHLSGKKSLSPTMQSIHSINTWSSASKSRSFVAIHDLVNKTDVSFNMENDENNLPETTTAVVDVDNDWLDKIIENNDNMLGKSSEIALIDF